MQNTITSRRIPLNLIALMVLLVTVAALVGFVAGLTAGKSSSALLSAAPAAQVQARTSSPVSAQFNAPIAGWIYYRDSTTHKWYAYHYLTISMGDPIIGESYELLSKPEGAVNSCGLDRAEPDC